MGEFFVTAKPSEKAVLIGVIHSGQDARDVEDYLDELEFLAETAGATVIQRFVQKIEGIHPKTYIGQGKLEEIKHFAEENEIDLIIFDDELSPSQLRNVDQLLQLKVLDRTNLILDIFAQRAQTAYAKTQVELAQYEYLLPRLTRMWTHLERQRGGIGLRGPGETEIETDRRIIRTRISKLKEDLKKIDRQMFTQRKNRGKLVRVALVGYTNVGKSTIMNMVGKAEVFAENKLFATLDTTVRKVVIGNLPFLLSDTVGFIRKLPTTLVESFKSTLDELRESDILLHVVDISHPGFQDQVKVVKETLQEIGANDKINLVIFNKIDAYRYKPKDEDDLTPGAKENLSLEELKNSWMVQEHDPAIFISATEKTNLAEFRALLYRKVREVHIGRYPYDNFLYPDVTF